jgi:hypothetical protein
MQSSNMVISKGRIRVSWVMSGLAAVFFFMDGGMKLVKPAFVVEATTQLGYPESSIVGIGVALILCTILYLVPRTKFLGAILLTGYLGGAVASNVRAGTPVFNLVFPILMAALAWGGLWLRDRRLRELVPLSA